MSREIAVRALGLYLPMAITGAVWWWRRPDRRLGAAALLACAWIAPALLMLHLVAKRAGWWTFTVSDGTFAGIPIDLYLGWILLWGAVPVLAAPAVPIPIVALALLWLDVLVMPLCAPVVHLKSSWLIGEAIAIALVLMPALHLAQWTATNRHVGRRAALQVAAFSGLVLFVIPAAVLEQTGGTWRPLLDRPGWWTNLFFQVLALPAVLGLAAVREFASRGGGTPVPFDPPVRLVSTGPYAYVANPMQLAMCLVLIGWAGLVGSWWVLAGSVTAFAYGAGFAAWHEGEELRVRYGSAWATYRNGVRSWWPRWRPFAMPGNEARLYVAESCGLCRDVGEFLKRRGATGIEILAAETYAPRELIRMTYVHAGAGQGEEGVAAFARALEHVNFAWAWVGMLMRLPIVQPALQLLVDASGGYRRSVTRVGAGC